MTQENKELLLKDLCARLPYGVKCINIYWSCDGPVEISNIDTNRQEVKIFEDWCDINDCKPYLRPMSSMTFEERSYCLKRGGLGYDENDKLFDIYTNGLRYSVEVLDFLNSHRIDYRGLIEKGLALEAPEGMYNIR